MSTAAGTVADRRRRPQRVDLAAAAAAIRDGATVAVGGFVGAAHPEALTAGLETPFQQEARPRDLTLIYAAGQGDGRSRGLNHLAHEGLLARVISGARDRGPRPGGQGPARTGQAPQPPP